MRISVFDVSQFYFPTAKSVTSECAGETRGGPEVGRRSAYAPVVRWPPRAACTKQFSFDFIQQPRRHDINK